MRIHNYVIIFVVVAICCFVVIDIKVNSMEAVLDNKNQIEHNIITAIDDGVKNLVQVGDSNKLIINKDAAVNSFFSSLYTSLGVTGDKDQMLKFNQYVPVIIVTMEDGYYIFYSDEYRTSVGTLAVSKRWSEKQPYYYEDKDFIYSFTLGDIVTLYDKSNCLGGGEAQSFYNQDYHDIQIEDEYLSFRNTKPEHILLSDAKFNLVRKGAILDSIEAAMAYYTSHHNHIAKQYGITYNFSLPAIREEEWVPYLDDVSMFVVFQGYPYGNQVGEVYNRVVSSGAKVSKDHLYYLEQIDWYYIYHRVNCPELDNGGIILFNEPLYDIESCAKEGAYACPICNESSGANAPDYNPLE
jgi:hypothetical protein